MARSTPTGGAGFNAAWIAARLVRLRIRSGRNPHWRREEAWNGAIALLAH
jgi:hypothetical protein